MVTRSPAQSAVTRVGLDRDRVGHVGDIALADDDRRGGDRGRRVALHDRRPARRRCRPGRAPGRGRRSATPSWTSGEPGSSAASTSRIGGRSSYSTSIASSAAAGDLRRQRRDRGDDLPLEADDVAGEQRAVEDEVERAVAAIRHVVGGEDREDARDARGRGPVSSRTDPGVRSAGEQEPGVGEPGEREVGRVAGLTGRLGHAVGPESSAASRSRSSPASCSPPWLRATIAKRQATGHPHRTMHHVVEPAVAPRPIAPLDEAAAAAFLAAIRDALPGLRLLTDEVDRESHRRDETPISRPACRSRSPCPTDDRRGRRARPPVRRARRADRPARRRDRACSGGAAGIEGALTIAFTRMDRILEIDHANLAVTTQPGIVNAALKARRRGARGCSTPRTRRATRCARSAATWARTPAGCAA